MKLVKRSSFGWPSRPSVGTAPCRNGLVAHYDGSKQNLAGKSHSACVTYWKNTRKFHMGPSRGWSDIGYSYGVCPHGYVFEGRGFGYQQAAQPGGNSTWTSCTFMTGDGEKPTSLQLQAWRELRAYLRGRGLAAAIKGHQNFISTSCPGSVVQALVKNSKSALYTGSTTTAPAKPTYWKLTVKGKPVTVPWATPFLRKGSNGKRVGWLQTSLNAAGASPKLRVDDDFGSATEKALKSFQRRSKDENGKALQDDGVYGHHTARGLYIALGGKKEDSV